LVIPAVGPKLAPELFRNSKIQLVQVTGAGVDRLDADTMRELGIAVANVAGASNAALAEYVVGTALNLLRRLSWADSEIREGRYAAIRTRILTDSLSGLGGLTIGIVGLGAIGCAVAKTFDLLGSQVIFYDPAIKDAAAPNGVPARSVELDRLLETADVVTLHVPLIPATKGLIGSRELGLMKPEAVLINAARGGIVDEEALAACLMAGTLGGAAIDVYEDEPPSTDNPLFVLTGEAARRLLFTPHIAGVTRQSWVNLFRCSWENVERVLKHGEPPQDRVY
jgi:phosphoglycerate dehydrogenase-like enzyme